LKTKFFFRKAVLQKDIKYIYVFLSQKLMTPGGGLRALISRRPPGYQMGLLYGLATRQLS